MERGLALGLLLAEKRLNPFTIVPSLFGRVGLHKKYDGTRPAGSFAQYQIDTNKWEKLPDLPDTTREGGRASSRWIDYWAPQSAPHAFALGAAEPRRN